MDDLITIDGRQYVACDAVATAADSDGLPYVLVRTYSAGVFAGYLQERGGKECRLRDARRIWYWKGAASLSELAAKGTADPAGCKFPQAVPWVELTEVIEVLPVSKVARSTIDSVPEWTEHDA